MAKSVSYNKKNLSGELFDELQDDSCCGGEHGDSNNINQNRWERNDYNDVIAINHRKLAENQSY